MEFKKIIFIPIAALLFQFCTKEKPISAFERGDVEIVHAEMGANYENQVWVDLGSASIIKTAPKSSWDIAFLTRNEEPYLIMNSALAMKAAITNTSDWNASLSPNDFFLSADHASGDLDSIRAGKWWEHDKIVIIDLGLNSAGNSRGYCKFKGVSYENGTVTFQLAKLDNSNEQTVTITIDDTYTQNEYSFFNEEIIQVSPPKKDYDIILTGYMEHFYDEGLEYLVTGVLLNRFATSAYSDTINDFSEILDLNQVDANAFSFDKNSIGYDWKYYNFDNSMYEIIDNCYVIFDQEGFTYKIRFVDFYSEDGVKGHPKFEIKLL